MFTRTSPSTGTGSPEVTGFYDSDTGSIMYVAADPATKKAALIDVVLDFDAPAGRTRTETALEEWTGKRAGSGRMAPRGFPRDNKFN